MSIFTCKQFEVDQSGCAMRINTDGVLLGAMANFTDPKYILDVGTGTGIIALMLAQRFPFAKVEGVEIDPAAADTANRNFQNSPFSTRLRVHNVAFQDYSNTYPFHLIVSNPPFFTNDLKNSEPLKRIARHTDDSFFDRLLSKSSKMLTANGRLALIVPPKRAELLISDSAHKGLFLSEIVSLKSFPHSEVFRQILFFDKAPATCQYEDFILYQEKDVHSTAYKSLLKDFFLLF